MLDLEIVVPAEIDATAIVSVAELRRHMRITVATNADLNDELEAILNEAAAVLHGAAGNLRRTIFPTTYKRYLRKFPDLRDDRRRLIASSKGVIKLPFPPLVSVLAVTVEDDESPTTEVSADDYVVKAGLDQVAELEPKAGSTWPSVTEGPRACSVTYTAGYVGEYPLALKRMLKILAAHNYENPEASINEPRQLMVNRRVEFAMEDLRAILQVPYGYDEWDEDA